MLNVLLLEDEVYTRRFLKKLVQESPHISNVFDVAKGEDAIDIAKEYQLDIALLDIELGENEELNGLEVAKIMSYVSPETKFIFLTGYSKYAIDSFSVHPYDYILKPVQIEKVMETIGMLGSKIMELKKYDITRRISLQNKNETIFISLEEIIFIESDNRGTLIHCKSGTYSSQQILSKIEKQLSENFYRVHKSYIVNKDKIRKIKQVGDRSYEIEFVEFKKVAYISRNKFEELSRYLIP